MLIIKGELMKLKILGTIGLIFLIVNQLLLLKGNDFIQAQNPIDYTHWLLMVGVLLSLSFNHIFDKSNFNSMASILTSLGVIALMGQAIIDFVWWSYGSDHTGMNNLINQLMNKPSIRIPFITLGPALFYLGLAMHTGKYLKTHAIWSIVTIIGVIIIGLGSFIYDSRILIVLGHLIFTLGILALVYKKRRF